VRHAVILGLNGDQPVHGFANHVAHRNLLVDIYKTIWAPPAVIAQDQF